MMSLMLHPRCLRCRCLLLIFMSVAVRATPDEGAVLLNWRNSLTQTGGKLDSWGAAGSSEPCGRDANWLHVSCDSNGNVQRLNLDSLGLSGTLAPELGLLSKLKSLSLHNNSFFEQIPEELGSLPKLVSLNLSENQLSGLIPDTFDKLTNLQFLGLSNNKLSGPFPDSLTRLPGLSSINLDSNSISGVLNVTRLLELIEGTSTYYMDQPLGVVSLMKNNISDVVYQTSDVLSNRTVVKLHGNPYCAGSTESCDEGRIAFCQQNCSITRPSQGSILWNWKQQLSITNDLFNWASDSDPCGNNPWFCVLCDDDGQVIRIDLRDRNLAGSLVPDLGQLSELSTLTLSGNQLNGALPQELGNLRALEFLDLSDNQLSDPIPETFGNLTNLSTLKLNNNNFSGAFPEFLMRDFNLVQLNLDNNSISGILNYSRIREIVEATANLNKNQMISGYVSLTNNGITDVAYHPNDLQNAKVIFRLQENPYCYDANNVEDDMKKCFCQQKCTFIVKKSQRLAIILGVTSFIILFIFTICLGIIYKRHTKLKVHKLRIEYQNKFAELDVNPQPFLYNDLRFATQNFNQITKLGQGSFGIVYKGMLSNGNVVAIKKLEPMNVVGGEVDDFLNEVVFITKMKHRNLVNLKGYCMRGNERMLVYEYVENTDVEQCLLKGKNKEAMTWHVRHRICLGVAQGLHYLHTYAEPRVIHRDIKASNILLDANYIPKIADFGLALLFPIEKTHISTANVAGTRGYLAPEYVMYGQLSEKADVYSFGVLCLEILSGRKNIDSSRPLGEVYLPGWAWVLCREGKLKDLIDPSMRLVGDEEMEVLQVLNIVLSCLQQNPDRRPSMNDVQMALQWKMELEGLEILVSEAPEVGLLELMELQNLTSSFVDTNAAPEGSISNGSTFDTTNYSEIGGNRAQRNT